MLSHKRCITRIRKETGTGKETGKQLVLSRLGTSTSRLLDAALAHRLNY
jgi:hypothetical protein